MTHDGAVRKDGRLVATSWPRSMCRLGAVLASALVSVLVSSCASNPVPHPTARPVTTTLVSVIPTGFSYALAWSEPVGQLTDGANTFKVVGPGDLTIERVATQLEPSSSPVSVAWSGIRAVVGTLNQARSEQPGYDHGSAAIALRRTLEPAPGAVLREGAFYNLVMLLQTAPGFSQPWGIVTTDVTYRVGDGPSRTLRIPDQVQVT